MRHAATIVIGLILWLAIWPVSPALAAEDPAPVAPPTASTPAAPDTPAPMTDIHDIRPPVPVGVDLPPWLIPVLLALAAVAFLAALWWWWRRHRKERAIETIVPELPPEMVAMQALDTISDVRGQNGKAFYFQLSAILRQYVFGRYAVGAPEMTTEEFVPCVDRLPIDGELARQLKNLCRAMDPVKFGGLGAEEKQMETDLFFVRGFVRQTTPESGAEANQADPVDAPKALPPGEA
ncbi:DUF4381 family protein [Desulfosarcina ovata]|uniref:DUF4381 domain-containing protein n=1 Tax=Desulfosarcina ovata subsp. ovata TaxID=2752305 RepID=A0A5K8ACG9_9BACT|nr:DUF4381 family protein [Desulfosarcina ovata]BBO90315.1 hypothetical protein DSCOOX_34950 [Desulfosarcina ovata subsp. ovata]